MVKRNKQAANASVPSNRKAAPKAAGKKKAAKKQSKVKSKKTVSIAAKTKGKKSALKKTASRKKVAFEGLASLPQEHRPLGCCIIRIGNNINRIPNVTEQDCRDMIDDSDGATGNWQLGPCPE